MGLGWLVWNLLNGFANCGPSVISLHPRFVGTSMQSDQYDQFCIILHIQQHWRQSTPRAEQIQPDRRMAYLRLWTHLCFQQQPQLAEAVDPWTWTVSAEKCWGIPAQTCCEFGRIPCFPAAMPSYAQYGYPCNRKVTAIQGTRRHVYRGLGSSDWRSAFRMCWAHNEGNLQDVFCSDRRFW